MPAKERGVTVRPGWNTRFQAVSKKCRLCKNHSQARTCEWQNRMRSEWGYPKGCERPRPAWPRRYPAEYRPPTPLQALPPKGCAGGYMQRRSSQVWPPEAVCRETTRHAADAKEKTGQRRGGQAWRQTTMPAMNGLEIQTIPCPRGHDSLCPWVIFAICKA